MRKGMVRNADVAVFVRRLDWPGPRVVRMMTVARRLGLHALFVGARRDCEATTAMESAGFTIERIGRRFRRFHGRRPLGYLGSVCTYNAALFCCLWRLRPGLVHVSDFEVYAGAKLYTCISGAALIYNIHDNLALRYRFPEIAQRCLNLVEGVAVRLATVTVVPEAHRRDALPVWSQAGVIVLRNTPIDPGYSQPPESQNSVTLLYAGWIDAKRGIRQIARLAGSHPSLRLRIAGSGDSELLAEIAGMDRVKSLGLLSHDAAMAETSACDFVCALYDPEVPVNRYAASNKVAEALALGRPLLINKGLEIVKELKPYRCMVVVDYQDVESVAPVLVALRSATNEYEEMCRGARQAYEDHYSWERVKEATIDAYHLARVRCGG